MVDLLVIQSTPFCNINCSYCYLPTRDNTEKITIEILDAALSNLLSESLIDSNLSIVWHAGEPLAIPINYFRELLGFIKKKLTGINIQHSIQTNGTLINQEWCDLVNEFNIRIGISVDGPAHLHDANRVTRNKKGTHAAVMKGIEYLKQNNIPYHAIAVVTKKALDYPHEFFSFFESNGFYSLGINIEEIEGINAHSSLKEDNLELKVKNFYSTLFELYIASQGKMKIREYDRALNAILRNPEVPRIEDAKINTHQLEPLAIISIDCKGNFSTFSPELLGQVSKQYGNFNLGNVKEILFTDATKTDRYSAIDRDIKAGIASCKNKCDYFHVCGGGAPSNKLYENGSFNSTETMYCKFAIQQPIDIVLSHLEKEFN